MIVIRRRLIFWLIKEYLKKWGKAIVLSFIIGLTIFFFLLQLLNYFLPKIPVGKNEVIGIVGAYRTDNLPELITKNISLGLTQIDVNGNPKPGIAASWKIEDNGKKYTFYIKRDIKFSDNSKVTSNSLPYKFADVKIQKPNPSTIIFELKDSYSPFLITVSHPIFKEAFVGTGEYFVKNISVNGDFVQSITLAEIKNSYKTKTYQFYPDQESLKTAYVIGEVSKAIGLSNLQFKNESLEKFLNTKVSKHTNHTLLITLFFNTKDSVLSDKRIRSALSYALPDSFLEGQRSYMPFPSTLWAYTDTYNYSEDIDRAKILLSATESGTKSATIKLDIKTLAKYEKTAKTVAESWKRLGIESKITVVETIPASFQVFLGDFFVPKDPDQYTLWHSDQINNITKYENKRIDKLLEDGRKIVDKSEREKLYNDFQKYLVVDAPAIFLYFPYEYEITRK